MSGWKPGDRARTADEAIEGLRPKGTFSITNETGRGRDTRIVVDGEDISGACQHLTIEADVEGPISVEVTPGVFEHCHSTDPDVPARLFIINAARELLLKHGWTPPA